MQQYGLELSDSLIVWYFSSNTDKHLHLELPKIQKHLKSMERPNLLFVIYCLKT